MFYNACNQSLLKMFHVKNRQDDDSGKVYFHEGTYLSSMFPLKMLVILLKDVLVPAIKVY